jgi:hypothetical protein
MRRLVAVFALAIALLPAGADAQSSSRWVAPNRDFNIELGAHGWRVLDPAANAELYHGEVMIAAPDADPQADSRCSVEVLTQPVAVPSRQMMNGHTRALMYSPTVEQMRNDPRFRHDRVEIAEIDGVTTLDVYGQFMSLDTVTRRFYLAGDGVVLMYVFSCSVSVDNAQAVASARAIAASLRFAE